MTKRCVLDVGNCGPDHSSIRRMLNSNFGAEVLQAHGLEDTLQALKKHAIDLVLINRKLDQDYSDGTLILSQIKASAEFTNVPVMLITNYPEYQEAAVSLGALPGFGKLEMYTADTQAKLASVLSASTRSA